MSENKLKNINLVIFDLDGTLIDSNGANNQLDIEMLHYLGENEMNNEQIVEERTLFFKRQNDKEKDIYMNYCRYLKEKYKSKLSVEEILQYRRELSKELSKNIKFKPNADKVIKYLKKQNFLLALATVSRRETINIYTSENRYIKNKCNINKFFDLILTKDDVNFKKPHPEIYNKIIAELNIKDLSKCIVVEDSLSGVMAAKRANLKVIVIYDKYSDKDRKKIDKLADYKVKDFKELIKLFKS